jgi:hypothetical protein
MYTNIPKIDIINIINTIIENNQEIGRNIQKETMLEQNYFQVDQKYYKQTDGLAMGAPTLSILAETYRAHGAYTNILHPKKTTNSHIL